MTFEDLYHFNDFTLKNYIQLLVLAKKKYSFAFFDNKLYNNRILLRHDVEFSIPIALKMAQIEADLGIKATYFIQVHSDFYNTLERETINAVKSILDLGHEIGLHFDSHYWNITKEENLDNYLKLDKQTLELYAEKKIRAFSFHNTSKFLLSCRKDKYAGLINVYSNFYWTNYAYNADSLGYWRFERLEDRIKEAKENSIQILIHDGMWQDEVLPPRKRIHKVIDDRATHLKHNYDSLLKRLDAKNIDWDKTY